MNRLELWVISESCIDLVLCFN